MAMQIISLDNKWFNMNRRVLRLNFGASKEYSKRLVNCESSKIGNTGRQLLISTGDLHFVL